MGTAIAHTIRYVGDVEETMIKRLRSSAVEQDILREHYGCLQRVSAGVF